MHWLSELVMLAWICEQFGLHEQLTRNPAAAADLMAEAGFAARAATPGASVECTRSRTGREKCTRKCVLPVTLLNSAGRPAIGTVGSPTDN